MTWPCLRPPKPTDHSYGPGNQRLRFYRPRGKGPFPLLIYFPGGMWQFAKLEDGDAIGRAFARAGIAVAVVVTDQAPGVSLTEMVRQADNAVKWLLEHPLTLRIDSDRMVISGHSSGAHLAVIAAVKDNGFFKALWRVLGCVSLSGVYDLEPSQRGLPQLNITDEEVERLSPLRRKPEQMPPLLLAGGEDEGELFKGQQAAMVQRWRDLKLPLEEPMILTRERHDEHDETPSALANPKHELHRRVRAMCRGES